MTAKVPHHVPAFTVNRNCASGLESIVEAAYRIRSGDADLIVAACGGIDVAIPSAVLGWEAQKIWTRLARAEEPRRHASRRCARFRPRHFKPVVGLQLGLTDPISGLNMGETAELLAREFAHRVARSRTRSRCAATSGPRRPGPRGACDPRWSRCRSVLRRIERPPTATTGSARSSRSEALAKLRPVFDRPVRHGHRGQLVADHRRRRGAGAAPRTRRARELGLNRHGAHPLLGLRRMRPGAHGAGPGAGHAAGLAPRGGSEPGPDGVWSRSTRPSPRRCWPAAKAFGIERFLRAPPGQRRRWEARSRSGSTSTAARSRWAIPVGASGGRLVLTLLARDGAARTVAGAGHPLRRWRPGRGDGPGAKLRWPTPSE